eukprot:gb/GECH01014838.1/.p1 GENE.gb/GECH01014838.1/~~gb/GECH01014838.1/.p1  ORF type:complete len:196 (+),score=62.13 gb/GECH01014838.1/:1-588(+)
MNQEEFVLDELIVDYSSTKDALRCLISTILFHRALQPVEKYEKDCENCNLTYVRVYDLDITQQVEESLKKFGEEMKKYQEASKSMDSIRTKVTIGFYTLKKGFKTDKHYWEQWVIPIAIVASSSEKFHGAAHLEDQLRARIFAIIENINQKQGFLPKIEGSRLCYPFDITFPVQSSGWGSSLWNLFRGQSSPSLV